MAGSVPGDIESGGRGSRSSAMRTGATSHQLHAHRCMKRESALSPFKHLSTDGDAESACVEEGSRHFSAHPETQEERTAVTRKSRRPRAASSSVAPRGFVVADSCRNRPE